ncbi:MAG: NAD(P)-dependent dehydrogenase (short-subunit alcohol dehydrogenase family) [Francisellaceae bacterium]|jgi:NAD(P)-dependent dehydrogenase (short-subunit alcohol dehydrogenase family)
MKIILVGASGTVGRAVYATLSKEHEVIGVSRSTDISVDIGDRKSIENMYKKIGSFDALVSATGSVAFKTFEEFTDDSFGLGLNNKLMGQVNLVQEGLKYINQNGSFTLTSGILNHEPILGSVSASMVNGALDAFVKAASLEIREKARLNIVSPGVVTESLDVYGEAFKGFISIDAKDVAMSYVRSVEGILTGKVFGFA